MLQIGTVTAVEYSITATNISTMQSLWLVLLRRPGSSKTVGNKPGEKTVISDSKREIPVLFVRVLLLLCDYIDQL